MPGCTPACTDLHGLDGILSGLHPYYVERDRMACYGASSDDAYYSLLDGYDDLSWPEPPYVGVHMERPSLGTYMAHLCHPRTPLWLPECHPSSLHACFLCLPLDVHYRIFSYLDSPAILSLRLLCKAVCLFVTPYSHCSLSLALPRRWQSSFPHSSATIQTHVQAVEFALAAFVRRFNLSILVTRVVFSNWYFRPDAPSRTRQYPMIIPPTIVLPSSVVDLLISNCDMTGHSIHGMLGPFPSLRHLTISTLAGGSLTVPTLLPDRWLHDSGIALYHTAFSEACTWFGSARHTLEYVTLNLSSGVDSMQFKEPTHFYDDLVQSFSSSSFIHRNISNLVPPGTRFPHRLSFGNVKSLTLTLVEGQTRYIPALLGCAVNFGLLGYHSPYVSLFILLNMNDVLIYAAATVFNEPIPAQRYWPALPSLIHISFSVPVVNCDIVLLLLRSWCTPTSLQFKVRVYGVRHVHHGLAPRPFDFGESIVLDIVSVEPTGSLYR
ncbi:hypothetical protein BDZ89DRAFT_1149878 [Hymenopellis radicata]|nr:hypothetical protein BDZ89DRAFT_1149878 [Hymenopellis radicata]